jgi:hypothetical protein
MIAPLKDINGAIAIESVATEKEPKNETVHYLRTIVHSLRTTFSLWG